MLSFGSNYPKESEMGGNPNEGVSKEDKEIEGDVSNLNGLAVPQSSRPKGASQTLLDGKFVVPWTNPSSRSENKKKLLERIANIKLDKENANLSIKI